MQKLRIIGGIPLRGEVRASGAKNAALPIMAAALLTDQEVTLDNVPDLSDTRTMERLLVGLGASVSHPEPGRLVIRAADLSATKAPYDLVKTMRASILALGPLTARAGQAEVSLPGGCAIGARPVDQHIKALRRLGATISIERGYVRASCDRLRGARVVTDMVTVTGTENIMMAATLARGRTIIENAAREPEVVDLAQLLRAMGARISGAGTSVIEIEGVDRLAGATHRVIGDRVEAGTFLCAALATGGEVTVSGVAPTILEAVIDKLRQAGATVETGPDAVRLRGGERPLAVDVRTAPYPGFPTDMQAQFMALDAIARGSGRIVETIFENRFMHVPELQRMGADIAIDGHAAVVRGVSALTGARVMATDLRASASLVVAALAARGETIIDRVYHLDRGYERIEAKLAALGASIERLPR